jgi:hypothetical protein
MAIVSYVDFSIQIIADGTSTVFTISLLTGPVFFAPIAGYNMTTFSVTGIFPNAVTSLASTDGTGVSATLSSLLKTMTVTFASAPAAGIWQVVGRFTY